MQDQIGTTFAFALNNGLDDDEALRNAINESLETEMIPPDRRIGPEILQRYDEATLNNPVSEKACRVLKMVEKSRNKLMELINMDLTTFSSRTPPNTPSNKPSVDILSESQEILRQQNEEYHEALANAQAREITAHEEEEEAEQLVNYVEMIKNKLELLGNEPKDGLLLAVTLPEGQRISRRFVSDVLGADIYVWVSANDEMISSNRTMGTFNIVGPTGNALDYEKPLKEQNIASRTLFSILDK